MAQLRELVGDALAVHESRGVPPPGRLFIYRPMLGPEPIAVRRREPNLGPYALELTVRSPELAAGSDRLAGQVGFRDFWCATGEAYEFVRRNVMRGKKRRSEGAAIGDAVVERFARDAAIQERERLLRRMAVNLETEAWAGRGADPANRLAARTWVALREELAPFHEVPYVRALSRRAIEAIRENLAMGFRSQQEANAAAMP
jgi:hypothetical protein